MQEADYVAFEGAVEPMEWGKSTYTILRVPSDVVAALGLTKRVEGEINDHPVNLALTKAPVIEDVFLWAGKSLLREAGLEPGEVVEVRIRPVSDDEVDVPAEVTMALLDADLTGEWDALSPGKQRGLLYQVKTAKRSETRIKRIAKLIEEVGSPGFCRSFGAC